VIYVLELKSPLKSLRILAGDDGVPMTGKALGQARGVTQATAHQAEAGGEGITLSTLRAYVEAIGGTMEIQVTLPAKVAP
jgi:predicted transcriptional regulator